MDACLRSCFGDFGRKSRLGSGILERVGGGSLRIRRAACKCWLRRVFRGKCRRLSWYGILKRVCGGSLGIRSAVCRCWLRCVSRVARRRRFGRYKDIPKFFGGWT